ncbi:hypothetical protein K9U39_20605 [Rhodoblastus acidophilus]|nr:hypothetical protein [Rhodoblastus acidophilus]
MRYPTRSEIVRRRHLIIACLTLGTLVIAVVSYSLQVRPSPATPGTTGIAPSAPRATTTKAPVSPVADLAPLRPTSEPDAFARLVAAAIFEWNTATLVGRSDHVQRLVAVSDPSGESSPGLVSDIDNYLPTEEAWAELARYETAQWLDIESVVTPTLWDEAEAQAGNELLPGTTAFTIEGTRHRSGIWENQPVASAHEVAFTVFIVCGPSYPQCHLLRLSRLDEPLD